MHISFAVFADAANLSQEGKLNVLGVFDAVQVAGLPTIHPRTHFIVRVKADGSDVGTHKLTFRWVSPSEEELWSSSGELNVAPAPNPIFEVDLPIIALSIFHSTCPGNIPCRLLSTVSPRPRHDSL